MTNETSIQIAMYTTIDTSTIVLEMYLGVNLDSTKVQYLIHNSEIAFHDKLNGNKFN